MFGTLKESLYHIRGKFMEWKLRYRIGPDTHCNIARLPSFVNKEIWLAKNVLLRHAIARNAAGGSHTVQLLREMSQK